MKKKGECFSVATAQAGCPPRALLIIAIKQQTPPGTHCLAPEDALGEGCVTGAGMGPPGAAPCIGMEAGSGAAEDGSLCPSSRSMCEDMEQSQPMEASSAVPRIQTPLLSRFFTAASPAISIKHLGRGPRSHPHLQRPRVDGGFPSPHPSRAEDPEAVACIQEEMEDESRVSEPTMAGGHLEGNWPLEDSEIQRKGLPLVQVKAPSTDSTGADQQEAWEPQGCPRSIPFPEAE